MSGKIRSSALAWADAVVEGTFFLMQNYLTDVWNLSFTDAAAFMNIWGGLYRILPIFLVFLTGKRRSSFLNFIMHAVSGIFSIVGLVVITYTALPGYRCHEKGEAECVGRNEKAVFITGMALVGVGRAIRFAFAQPLINGHDTSEHEVKSSEHSNLPSCRPQGKIFVYLRLILVILFFVTPAIAFLAFPYVKKWYILFGVAVMCTFLATVSHLSRFRKYEQPLSSPGRVILLEVMALFGSEIDTSSPESKPYHGNKTGMIRMVMMYSTCIVCGMVSSIGNTYFVQQATQMNYNIGHWRTPLQVLQIIFLVIKLWYGSGYSDRSSEADKAKVEADANIRAMAYSFEAIGNSLKAIFYSVLCCAVAAAVERRRVHSVRRHHLVEQPDDVRTPMSAFWLLFQVCFLGAIEGCMEQTLSAFHEGGSLKRYGACLSEAVTGLGYMCSVLSVYVVGKISETGGGKGWFQHTLNGSRLDRYYWVLTALTAVFLVVHVTGVGIIAAKKIKKLSAQQVDGNKDESNGRTIGSTQVNA